MSEIAAEIEKEIKDLRDEIDKIEDEDDFAPVSIEESSKKRRKRLAWHIFWITTGMILGFIFTFFTAGLFLHIAIIGTSLPALAQEITDFAQDL
jgi:hypothetical protein